MQCRAATIMLLTVIPSKPIWQLVGNRKALKCTYLTLYYRLILVYIHHQIFVDA